MTKRKKKGHVAIPFLIALLLGILVLGGIAMFLFGKIGLNDVNVVEMKKSVTKPTAADNMTLLFVLDEEADPMPTTFLLARVLPEEKKIVLLSFPANMLAAVDGKTNTLEGYYRTGGIQAAEKAIETEAGIATDRYIILDSAAFQKICNIYTGVYFTVPTGTKGFTDSGEPQYRGPGQMEKLVTYPFFSHGEIDRSAITADMMCEMINQSDSERIVQSMDTSFKTLVNMIQTDITAMDYSDKKSALKYMYTYGSNIAQCRFAVGSRGEDADVFLLDTDFRDTISEVFGEASQTEEETTTAAPEE